jgi:hypothetical protein
MILLRWIFRRVKRVERLNKGFRRGQLVPDAETGAALTLFYTSYMGIPVSTTHTITGAIVGVGASWRLSAVRWTVASRVVLAWLVTIPGASAIAAATSLDAGGRRQVQTYPADRRRDVSGAVGVVPPGLVVEVSIDIAPVGSVGSLGSALNRVWRER